MKAFSRKILAWFNLVIYFRLASIFVYSIETLDDYPWLKSIDWAKHGIVTNSKSYTVAFYHIYAQGNLYKNIVKEQINLLNSSGLIEKLDKVLYVTIGAKKDNFSLPLQNFEHLKDFENGGEELYTLSYLYRFCHAFPHSKVLYFHDKGSFHSSPGNERFRRLLDCYVLTPNCLEVLSNYDTCGWRITPTPHIHYSGNFWWARCHYIKNLIDPLAQKVNQTFVDLTNALTPCIGASDRYFAETWIGSGPTINPADCMSASIDTSFLYGYKFPESAFANCPSANGQFGAPCNLAGTLLNAEKFSDAFNAMKNLESQRCRVDLDADITQRSMIWYGQIPSSYLSWIKRMKPVVHFEEGSAVKGIHQAQVYYVKNGSLHAVPNANTFFSLGFDDFNKVRSVFDYQLTYAIMGDPIPSV